MDATKKVVEENPWTVGKIVGAWFGLKVVDQITNHLAENAFGIAGTTLAAVTSPYLLPVTLAAWGLHIYYQH